VKTKLAYFMALLMILLVAVMISSCGSDEESTTTEAEESESTTTETEAEESEAFPTKDIKWIIQYPPGGGYDAYSRKVAQYMPKYLPQDVNVIPENLPGAGGRTAYNTLYNSEPDGYTIGIFNIPGARITELVQDTEYKLDEMTWLGSITRGTSVVVVAADSPYDTVEDLQNADEELVFATNAAGGGANLVTTIGAAELEIEPMRKLIYEGSQDALLAVIRGDADLANNVVAAVYPHIQSGDLKAIIVYSDERHELLPDTPTASEIGEKELAKLGSLYMVAGPPGMPKDRAKILEDALMATLEDPDMQQWSEEADRPLIPMNSEEATKAMQDITDVFTKYRDLLEE